LDQSNDKWDLALVSTQIIYTHITSNNADAYYVSSACDIGQYQDQAEASPPMEYWLLSCHGVHKYTCCKEKQVAE